MQIKNNKQMLLCWHSVIQYNQQMIQLAINERWTNFLNLNQVRNEKIDHIFAYMYSHHKEFTQLISIACEKLTVHDAHIQNLLQTKNTPISQSIANIQGNAGMFHASNKQYYSSM